MFSKIHDWWEQRKFEAKQRRFEEGFACVMVSYFHHELPLGQIADIGYPLANALADPFDDGYAEAIDRLNMLEEKIGGPLY